MSTYRLNQYLMDRRPYIEANFGPLGESITVGGQTKTITEAVEAGWLVLVEENDEPRTTIQYPEYGLK